ncbi:hypothetical protein [Streptomyces sp. NPDC002215]|uniref:hypothetical protein n=1 Tax=Streptomyces sp. NPDC002215 TaxID=3154412 RepID=UPI00332D9A2E
MRIRAAFPDVFAFPKGRIRELVALAQLLQGTERGDHLARHGEQLTGIPVPLPSPAA